MVLFILTAQFGKHQDAFLAFRTLESISPLNAFNKNLQFPPGKIGYEKTIKKSYKRELEN